MEWNQVAGNWNEAKGKVKTQWGKLTDDDLTQIEGNRDRLSGLLQRKYGLAKEKAEEQIEEFTSSAGSWVSKAKEKVTEAVKEGKEYLENTNVSDMAGDVRKLIERNPIPSIILGVGIGFLLGRLFSAVRS